MKSLQYLDTTSMSMMVVVVVVVVKERRDNFYFAQPQTGAIYARKMMTELRTNSTTYNLKSAWTVTDNRSIVLLKVFFQLGNHISVFEAET